MKFYLLLFAKAYWCSKAAAITSTVSPLPPPPPPSERRHRKTDTGSPSATSDAEQPSEFTVPTWTGEELPNVVFKDSTYTDTKGKQDEYQPTSLATKDTKGEQDEYQPTSLATKDTKGEQDEYQPTSLATKDTKGEQDEYQPTASVSKDTKGEQDEYQPTTVATTDTEAAEEKNDGTNNDTLVDTNEESADTNHFAVVPRRNITVEKDQQTWYCRIGLSCENYEQAMSLQKGDQYERNVCCRKQDCFTRRSVEYRGSWDTTVSGNGCQRWDEQAPHQHNYTNAEMFPDESLYEARNFCRDPNGSGKLWCLAVNSENASESCPVGPCAGSPKFYTVWSILYTDMFIMVVQSLF